MSGRRALLVVLVASALVLAVGPGLAQGPGPKGSPAAGGVDASTGAMTPWTTVRVDPPDLTSADNFGLHVSLAIDPTDDRPYISHYDATNGDLRVASPTVPGGGTCGPNNDWWCTTVANVGDVGPYSSIDIWQGGGVWKMGISYFNATDKALEYAEFVDDGSSQQWTYATIALGGVATTHGQHASLKLDSAGAPLIAYYQSLALGDDKLMFASQVASGGNCGEGADAGKWQCDVIDTGDGVGQYASLDLSAAQVPYIAYYATGDLRYAWNLGSGGNCGPSNTWKCTTIESTADVGRYASLHVYQGGSDKTQIAYYDATHGDLKHAQAVSAGSGNCGPTNDWQCDVIDAMGTSLLPMGVSLTVDAAGYPIIAYQDASEDLAPTALNVARPIEALGRIAGNCGPILQGGVVLSWQCDTLDGGGSWTNEADFVAVAVNGAGMATVAYHESDDYYGGGALKVAHQKPILVFLPFVVRNFP